MRVRCCQGRKLQLLGLWVGRRQRRAPVGAKSRPGERLEKFSASDQQTGVAPDSL